MNHLSVFNVAHFILSRYGEMSAMKLQKLVYYAQAWSLVWDEQELFPEEIEAWANGPVVRELYEAHRGYYIVNTDCFDFAKDYGLTDEQAETIDMVLGYYGDKNPQWLSDLTHEEDPWKNARQGMSPGQRGDTIITKAAMAEYYGSLAMPSVGT